MEKKKIGMYVGIVGILLVILIIVAVFDNVCEFRGCNNFKSKKIEEESRLELSDSQIESIKQVIKEYSNNLVEKQDSILAVNLLSDTPVTAYTTGITFNCNVVRTDSDTNLATIYVVMNSDGSFKVQSLMYDNE